MHTYIGPGINLRFERMFEHNSAINYNKRTLIHILVCWYKCSAYLFAVLVVYISIRRSVNFGRGGLV